MNIIRDDQLATLTLVPVDVEEEQIIASISAILKPEDKLSYGGREQDGEDDKFCIIHLHAGGQEEMKPEKISENMTIHRITHTGSVKLVLRGTTEGDKHEVGRIRDMCYFGSGGLIFIGETEVDGKKAVTTTGLRCKHCGAGMIRYFDCEWETCDVCATKCEHNYVRGAIHGGGIDIGIGEFCNKCGRGKPKAKSERKISKIEHHLTVENELGVNIVYKNGPPITPRQAIEVSRIVRRHNRSKRRNVLT